MNRHVLAVAALVTAVLYPQLVSACEREALPGFTRARGMALSQGVTVALTGSVIDQTERFVPKARLLLTHSESGKKRKTQSNRDGRFRFDDVPPGHYVLDVALPGFVRVKSDVSISNQDITHDVRLEVGGLSETVVITREQIVTPLSDIRTFPRRQPPACEGATERPIGGKVLPPMKIRDVEPTYPRHLKTAGIRGHVVVHARVGADGVVSEVEVVRPARQEFADSAHDAIAQWLFDPVYLNCQPMPMHLTVNVEFTDGH